MVAGLENVKQLTSDFYSQLDQKSLAITSEFQKWFQSNEFSDYRLIQFKSLFWVIPTDKEILNTNDIPENIQTRFFELFKVLLNKGVYLSPNAYEVGFVSDAHDEKTLEVLKERLWN